MLMLHVTFQIATRGVTKPRILYSAIKLVCLTLEPATSRVRMVVIRDNVYRYRVNKARGQKQRSAKAYRASRKLDSKREIFTARFGAFAAFTLNPWLAR